MNIPTILLTFLFVLSVFAQSENPSSNSEIQTQVIEQEEVKEELSKEKASAKQEALEAEQLAASAKKQAQKAETEAERALADFLSLLQTYRAGVLNTKLNKVKEAEKKIDLMREKTDILNQYENKIKSASGVIDVNDLQMVSQIWRDIVDETIGNLFLEDSTQLSPPPELPSSVQLSGDKFLDLKQKVAQALNGALMDKGEIEQNLARIQRSQRDVSARLLLNAGRVRANLMNHLISKGSYSVWDFNVISLRDYAREVQVVPYRFLATFAEKYFDFKAMSQEGLKGWLKIAKQAFLLLLVFLLPFVLFKLFRRFSTFLDDLRKRIFTSSQMDFRKRVRLSLWIGRLNPYLPWVFAYLTIKMAHSLLIGTLLEPFTIFLPYLNIYVLYRGFLIFFSAVLARTLLSKNLDRLRKKQSKVQATALKLSVLFFLEWAFLHATEDTVRQALIYNLIFDVIVYINVAIVAFEARLWKEELLELSNQWLNTKIYKKLTESDSFFVELIVYPILFFGNMIYLLMGWVYQWVSQFEVGKKLTSEIFKRRLEDVTGSKETQQKKLGDDYKSLFLNSKALDKNTQVTLSRSPMQKCVNIISEWIGGRSHEDLILLYGNFGIGKSTILNALERHFHDQVQIKRITFLNKVTTEEELYEMFSNSLSVNIKSTSDFERLDSSIPKTIFILDDIHNLYLNTTNGLKAYRTLIEVTSLQLEHVFWCLSSNERALAHLEGLFGVNHFIGSKIELLSWTDSEIQDLILKRHKQSEFVLKFDQVIRAVHRGDILESSSGLEIQFFRLLWGQSRGNPSTAQELWLSAASQESSQAIRISVPEFTNPRTLADLSDETLMVYAAIVKHENLSLQQLEDVCDLPVSVIRRAIKFGEDGMIIHQAKNGQWRVHPKAQYVVHAQLSGRNFIYG